MAFAIDPVCGMLLQPTDVAVRCRYWGLTFHFCSHACMEKFEAEPERFMVERHVVGQAVSPQSA
jgi:YHS domain-containing protein